MSITPNITDISVGKHLLLSGINPFVRKMPGEFVICCIINCLIISEPGCQIPGPSGRISREQGKNGGGTSKQQANGLFFEMEDKSTK